MGAGVLRMPDGWRAKRKRWRVWAVLYLLFVVALLLVAAPVVLLCFDLGCLALIEFGWPVLSLVFLFLALVGALAWFGLLIAVLLRKLR